MRTNPNCNLFVIFGGAKKKISPANINQINNIRPETLFEFFAMVVLYIYHARPH